MKQRELVETMWNVTVFTFQLAVGAEVHFAGIDSKSLHWKSNTENGSTICQKV